MKKKLVIIIPLIVLVLIPIFSYTKFNNDCNDKFAAALKEKQPQIDVLDRLALLGEQPAQKAEIKRGGDCVDSQPYVVASKAYVINETGAKAVDSIRSGLKDAGYTITKEDFGREGCALMYRVMAGKDTIKTYTVAYQKNNKDPSCTDGHGVGITEAYFRSQNIEEIDVTLQG